MGVFGLRHLLTEKAATQLAGWNGQTVIAASQATSPNLADTMTQGMKDGFTRQNLVLAIIYLSFTYDTPLLKVVLPRTAGTTGDITKQWTEMIFDANMPHRTGERGRAPLVNYRIVTRKASLERVAIGWEASMSGADQDVIATDPNGGTMRAKLLGQTLRVMESRFELTAIEELFGVEDDPERGVYRGLKDQNKSIEEYFATRNKLFGIFDKSAHLGLNVMAEISLYITEGLTAVGGEIANTLIVRETLAKRLTLNPNVTDYYKAGNAGPRRLKASEDALSNDLFSTLNDNDGNFLVIPIKDTTAFVNTFGGSIMTRQTIIGQVYPFHNRPDQFGTENWKQAFEDIEVYDHAYKGDVRLSMIDGLRNCGGFDADGNTKKLTLTERSSQFRDANKENLDMFQDQSGDPFSVFGQWSQSHMKFTHLSKWERQVILQLNKKYNLRSDFATGAAGREQLLTTLTILFKEPMQNLGVVLPLTLQNRATNAAIVTNILQAGPKFLLRSSDAHGANANFQMAATAINILNSAIALAGAPANSVILSLINDTPDNTLAAVAKLAAFARFKIITRVPVAADGTGFWLLPLGNVQLENQTQADARPDLKDAVATLSATYLEIFKKVKVLTVEVVTTAGIADALDAGTQAQRTAAIVAAYPDGQLATNPLRLGTYTDLQDKARAFAATEYDVMSPSDPNRPLTQDELNAFLAKHGTVFRHEPGTTRNRGVQSKLSALSPYMIATHFNNMNQDTEYREAFVAQSDSMDYRLKSFFLDEDMIQTAVGDKWKGRNYLNPNAAPAGFVQQILLATDSQFTDNWNTVSDKLEGLEQLVAKLFLLTPLTLDTLENFYNNEIPLPFSVFAVADHMIFEAEQMIACARGAEQLGKFLVTEMRLTGSNDGKIQSTAGTLTAIAGVHFTSKRNVVNLRDVKLVRAVQGCGTALLPKEKRLDGKFSLEQGITFHVAPIGTQLPKAWTTAGYIENDPIYRTVGLRQQETIPCMARLYDQMGMEELLDQAERDKFMVNTIIFRGKVKVTDDGYSFKTVKPGASGLGHLDGPYDMDHPLITHH